MDFYCEKFTVAPYPTFGPSTCQIHCHIKNSLNLGERLLKFSFPNTYLHIAGSLYRPYPKGKKVQLIGLN